MAYCSTSDVGALVGFSLDATTIPNSTQVSAWIDEVAAELDVVLAAQGATVPVTTPANAVTLLRHYNAVGVAARVEEAAYTQQRPNASERGGIWRRKYAAILEGLRSGTSELLGALLNTVAYSFPDPATTDVTWPVDLKTRF